MIFLLITFLVIALIVTILGLFLSSRSHQTLGRRQGYEGGGKLTPLLTTPGVVSRGVSLPPPWSGRGRTQAVQPIRVRASLQPLPVPQTGSPSRRLMVITKQTTSIATSTWQVPLFGSGSRRRATGITLGLVAIFLLMLYLLVHLLPGHALIGSWLFSNDTASSSAPAASQSAPISFGAPSQGLVRLYQLDPGQYNSPAQYDTWALATCSAATMTEVINAYGHHYRIADILKVESSLGEITPALGLLEDVGIQRTVAQFGFRTTWGYKLSLDQIITIANKGHPVIVSFPPSRYPQGHLVVVTGGNSNVVYIADSSLYNRHILTHAQFMAWWGGFSAVVTPK